MNNKIHEIVILAATRTPIGAYKGSLNYIKSDQLGSIVIKEVIKRAKINKESIDEVIMGQVLTSVTGQNPARQAAINAGLSMSVPAHLVNQVCGSGLRSTISGYQTLKLNKTKIELAINNDGRETEEIRFAGAFVNGKPVVFPEMFKIERRQKIDFLGSNVTTATFDQNKHAFVFQIIKNK